MSNRKVRAAADNVTYRQPQPRPIQAVRMRQTSIGESPEVAQVYDDLRSTMQETLRYTPFHNGRLLEVDLEAGTTYVEVPHHLDGPARGAIQVGGYNAIVYMTPIRADRADTHVKLVNHQSVTATVPMWVWR